ncbi:MAG: transporter suffix domain-containing protein [Saprospiraceae bacterium]|jgi:hypothetical protein
MKLKTGLVLIILSTIFYLLILLLPLFEFTITQKTVLIVILVILGELSFYIGLLFVGKIVWQKYEQKIKDMFCNLFSKN